ncbi:MAG: hypothetical protein JOS17DRAFT_805617 [Linnemannia elongata]|nr:MAG: hypothetical protein JOS17DRAFT_805617 [Linnemannia elongata]
MLQPLNLLKYLVYQRLLSSLENSADTLTIIDIHASVTLAVAVAVSAIITIIITIMLIIHAPCDKGENQLVYVAMIDVGIVMLAMLTSWKIQVAQSPIDFQCLQRSRKNPQNLLQSPSSSIPLRQPQVLNTLELRKSSEEATVFDDDAIGDVVRSSPVIDITVSIRDVPPEIQNLI